MKRRFLAVVLTATMVMGLSISASATTPTAPETVATGEIKSANVSISVPATITFQMNPYELNLAQTGDPVTDQILAEDILVENTGDTAINLSVNATAALVNTAGKTVLVTSADAVDTANKGVVAKNAFIQVGLKTAKAGTDGFEKDAFFKNGDKDVKVTLAKLGTAQALDAIQLEKDNDDTDNAKSRAYVDISGALAKTSTVAWDSNDALKITLKFSMVPTVVTPVTP